MRIGIIGIGAMGCLLGAHFSGLADVTMFGHWPEQIKTISESGLQMVHPDGTRTRHSIKITDDPEQVGLIDVALVVVKSRQTADAAIAVAAMLKPDGLAITLQNGLNNCATLRSRLGDSRVTLAVTSEGATVLGVAEVRHAGHGPTYFGRDKALAQPQLVSLSAVVELFRQAGFEAYVVGDTDSLVWGKLAVNAAINPLTALLRVPNGFLIEHQSLIAIMANAAREVAAVAAAQGIQLPFPNAAERAVSVAQATATNRSSMLQDIDRGALTEVEAICGAVARIAHDLGVSTPLNIRLCRLVRLMEGGEPPLIEQGDVEGLLKLLDYESIA